MALRDRLKRAERDALGTLIVVEHEDGTTSRFRSKELFPECFLHETARWRRRYFGEDPGEAHPFVVALRTATNLEARMSEQGTMLGTFLGEDEIMRGVRKRGGATVRETSPGGLRIGPASLPELRGRLLRAFGAGPNGLISPVWERAITHRIWRGIP